MPRRGAGDYPKGVVLPKTKFGRYVLIKRQSWRSVVSYTAHMGFVREQLKDVGVDAGTKTVSVLSYFGIWTQHVWVFWINTNNAMLPAYLPWQTLYAVLSLTMLVVVALSIRAARRGKRIKDKRVVDGFFAACAVVSTIFVGLSLSMPDLAFLSMPALVLGGVGCAWLYLKWGQFFSGLTIWQAIAFLFTGGMIAAAVKVMLAILPSAASAIIVAFLPVASILSCWHALKDPPRASQTSLSYTARGLSALWKVVVTFVVFSIANAAMLTLQPAYAAANGIFLFSIERTLEFLLCAGVLLYVFQLGKSFDFVQLWRLVLLALATDFLVNIVMPESGFESLFAGISLNFIVLFVWLVLSDVSHQSDLHPFVVFGVGWSCYTLPFYLGSIAALSLGLSSKSVDSFAVLLYAVAVTAAFFLESRDQNTRRVFADLRKDEMVSLEDLKDIDSRCQAIGRQKGLTAREIEVMGMLCRGRSKAYIAETLFVTENTIKGHTKNLYGKLGVHSKQELQSLIGIS